MKKLSHIFIFSFLFNLVCTNLSAQKVVLSSALKSNTEAYGNSITLDINFSTGNYKFEAKTDESYNKDYMSPVKSSGKNYIHTKSYAHYSSDPPSTLKVGDIIDHVSYFDGLGRPLQDVAVNAGPWGQDIIKHYEYDIHGRQAKKYLPVPRIGNNGRYSSIGIGSFGYDIFKDNYNGTLLADAEQYYFAESSFDDSPLNRVTEQSAPGDPWKISGGKTVEIQHTANGDDEVRDLRLMLNPADMEVLGFVISLNNSDLFYARNTLFKEITTDEEGNINVSYIDKRGKIIMKYTESGLGNAGAKDSQDAITYYLYDYAGKLRVIVPPLAVQYINNNPSIEEIGISSSIFYELCYCYQYDHKGRMIVKKIPGADDVYMAYNKRDLLIMTQDGNMRDNNQWHFTKYDYLNRPVLTGIVTNLAETTHLQVRNEAESTEWYEYARDGSSHYGYDNNAYPKLGNIEILTVTYYDDYNHLNNISSYGVSGYTKADFDFTQDGVDDFGQEINTDIKGQATGSLTRIIDESYPVTKKWLVNIPYYDDKYRVIITKTNNIHGGQEEIRSLYDFAGKINQTKTIHHAASGVMNDADITMDNYYEYDHAGRLMTEKQKIAGDNTNGVSGLVTLVSNAYNAIGKLIQKDQHGGLQTIDYRYNIRGWLKGINNPDQVSSQGDLFGMEINYNTSDKMGSLSSTELFNGNISSVAWKADGYDKKGYAYQYDKLSRLTSAQFGKGSSTLAQSHYYSLDKMEYDINGNITKIERNGSHILYDTDDLTLVYESNSYSNHLKKVTDNAIQKSEGYVDASNLTTEFTYDKNGNMITNTDKQITNIKYNYLNLPQCVTTSADKFYNHYDANGMILSRQDQYGDIKKQYIGPFVFEFSDGPTGNGLILKYIINSEGRTINTSSGYKYEYHLKDHLGNIMLAYKVNSNSSSEITQVNDYYPFGMKHDNDNLESNDNKYLYNGKEIIDDLGWYDYGRRMYDPALGRFHTQDRFAEKYSSITPYQYGANNPTLFVDVNGDSLWIKRVFGKALLYENGNLYNKDGSAYTGKQRGFLKNTVSALEETSATKTGGQMVSEIQSSKFNVTIKRGSSNSYVPDNRGRAALNVQAPGKFPGLAGSGGTIKFNPQSSQGGMTTRGNRDSQPFIGLAHEMAHSWDGIDGNINLRQIPGQTFTYGEHFGTHIENKIRAENGMPLRTHYGYNQTTNTGFYRILQPGGQSTFYGNNYYDDLKLKSITTPIPVQAATPTIIIK